MPDDALITVTDATFAETVLAAPIPVLVDFWATWCPPCGPMARVLGELAEEFDGRLLVAQLDVDANPAATIAYRVTSMPTLLFFSGGVVTSTIIGARPRTVLRQAMTNALSPYVNS
ncbi:thioredoxin [Actinoplanes philippinensis]|uniref:Thioredoxin n=1 Tax=Actinoplanes philippinensis TaxID=35752 RepID=A0A1I2J3E6_9ACTN|nr:thioredoxin domain-containing protein [Actinoplanes philippinensis]GIE79674.1 thioredoxin [Actinoplanes philippinensis]SFF48393.1 thioredoxin 1 [Actinoplanes philippinensis]